MTDPIFERVTVREKRPHYVSLVGATSGQIIANVAVKSRNFDAARAIADRMANLWNAGELTANEGENS